MSTSAYYNQQYQNLMSNPPQNSSSYYNQSFIDRINDAQSRLDTARRESAAANTAQQKAYDDYNSFTGTMSNYSDVYKAAEDEFGVSQAKDAYENNKKALAMTQSMVEALPSTINATSATHLTQSQRERRYNADMNRINATQNTLSEASNQYEQAWKNARENQAAKAEATIAQERAKQQEYNAAWSAALDKYHNTEQNVLSQQSALWEEKNAYSDWQYQQYQNAWNAWYTQMSSALTRYIQALKTETAQKQYELEYNQKVREAEAQKRKEQLAESLISTYQKNQQNKMIASSYDAGGIFGRLLYVSSHY